MKFKKKLLSTLLTICLVLTLMPAMALAVDQPVLTGNSVFRDTEATATVRFASDTVGTYFYQVTDSATVPVAESIEINGTPGTAAVGTNSITITGMTKGAKYVHIIVKNSDVYSDVLTVEMPYDIYYFDDFEAYTANTTVPTSYGRITSTTPQLYIRYNGIGDANQKVLSETQTDGTTGNILQMVGKYSWAADCRANITVPSGGYLVYEVDAKPVAGDSPVGIAVGDPDKSKWFGAAARLEMCNNTFKYGIGDEIYDITGSPSYTNGSWYRLKIILDQENHIQDLYCNGVMINGSPLDAGNFEPTFLSLVAGNSGSNTAYFDNVKLYITMTDPDPDKIYTYTYNTPADIAVNGVTATMSYDKDSPQPAGTLITATVTLTGTAVEAGTHTIGLASAADITGGVTAPSTVTKTVTVNQMMTTSDTFVFTFTMPAANVDDLALTHTFVEALTGTVNITGTEKYGSELTAAVAGSNNTGVLSYQWKRGGTDGTNIGSNQATYTLVEADINNFITCIVSSSVETGTISDTTSTIGKADTDAPEAPTLSSKSHNSITVTANTLHEFRLGIDGIWQTSNVFSGLAADTAYTIYARVAETTTNEASPASIGLAVTTDSVPINALEGTISITGTQKYNQILTADTTGITNNTGILSYQWKRGGTDGTNIGSNQATYTLVEADINSFITCIVSSSVETGTISDTTGKIGKADGPDAPIDLVGVKPTVLGASNGKIMNTTVLMQYDDNTEFTNPHTCGDLETTGLTAGIYYVRVAATTTTEAGAYATVTIPTGDAATYSVTISGSGVGATGTGTYAENTLVTIYAGRKSGYTFSGWTTTSSGVVFDSASNVTTTFSMPGNDVAITANWTYNGGGGDYTQPTTYDVPVESGEYSINALATVSGGTATVSVNEINLDTMLTDADTSGSVCIDVGLNKNIDTATIPTSVINKIADAVNDSSKDITDLKVILDSGSVSLDANALAATSKQATGRTISIQVKEITKADLTTAQCKALTGEHTDDLVVAVTIKSDNVAISNYDDGKLIIMLPYELRNDETAAGVRVWHLANDGTLTLMNCSYNEVNKTVSFVTDHLSNFIVGYNDITILVNPFIDVKKNDYFYNAVLWAVAEKITEGTSTTTFSPYDTCTRAQMATFLWRAAGSPEPTANINHFTDVEVDTYYYKAILWTVEKGITKGTSIMTFSPNDTCTRAQMATFLWRAAGSLEPTANVNPFIDVAASDYYYKAVIWAAEEGVTQGTNAAGTTFSPKDDCTRGQIMMFLYRIIENALE